MFIHAMKNRTQYLSENIHFTSDNHGSKISIYVTKPDKPIWCSALICHMPVWDAWNGFKGVQIGFSVALWKRWYGDSHWMTSGWGYTETLSYTVPIIDVECETNLCHRFLCIDYTNYKMHILCVIVYIYPSTFVWKRWKCTFFSCYVCWACF